jgi:Glycosyltransferase family 87
VTALLDATVRWHDSHRRARIVICGVLLIAASAVLVGVFRNPTKQSDLHVYYRAAVESAAGIDPYARDISAETPYDYPPLTLYVFRPLAHLEWRQAQQLWFLLKVVALIGFLWICHAYFVPLSGWSPATILFFAIGYNQAILLELRAGNVALFEQTFLLGGLAALVAGHYAWFIVLVLLAGQFKLVPLMFLALPLIVCRSFGTGIAWTLAGIGAATAYILANVLLFPMMFREFVTISRSLVDDSGLLNPSGYAFIRDVLAWLTGRSLDDVAGLAMGLFAIEAIVVAAVSVAAIIAHRQQPLLDRRALILFACTISGLVLYRFKNYAYILLLVPAFDIAVRKVRRREVPYSAFFVFVSVFGYGPLFGNLSTWYSYLGELRRKPT